MEWIFQLIAVGAVITMLSGAFRRGSDAIRRTVAGAILMAGLAFTDAGWVVQVGMVILLVSSAEFLFRPLHKVRREIGAALGALTVVTAAAVLTHVFPWVLFPLGCLVCLWYVTGGPRRNRRRRDRALRAADRQSLEPTVERASPADLTALANDRRIPEPARTRLHDLLRRADTLHQQLRSQHAATRLTFEVEQIHEDFAPSAVRGYLALPPTTASTTALQDGKTGIELFEEQLTMLHGALDDIAAQARTDGAQGLLVSYHFLRDKFGGTGEDDLRL